MARKSKKSLAAPFSFKAFLSHRYKSPQDNLYFFNLFGEISEVQFEVDEGLSVVNVTRLERMIRDCDAFIGIYPFPGSWKESQDRANLLRASQYFRLELDLAIRARKPAIIFYDRLYGNLFECPARITARDFDGHEIRSPGGSPRADVYRDAFRKFCDVVRTAMSYYVAQAGNPKSTVGLALPLQKTGGKYQAYAREIEAVVRENWDGDVEIMRWPPVLDREAFILIQGLDWAIVDIGQQMAETGLPAYLHGRFVPTMRLRHAPPPNPASSRFEQMIVTGSRAGYAEDILAWSDKKSLLAGIKQRIRAIKADVKRISTAAEAQQYFQGAAKRKEPVFLSYSGTNHEQGSVLSTELKRQFQKVFDYRDGESISAGQEWLDEIFDQLSAAAIGISLLSAGYLKSDNCLHEARELVANRDNKTMKFLPVYIEGEKIKTPSWMRSTQYLTWPKDLSVEDLVRKIIELIQ
jgi:hypothetical protein